jgi:hypothetical protein
MHIPGSMSSFFFGYRQFVTARDGSFVHLNPARSSHLTRPAATVFLPTSSARSQPSRPPRRTLQQRAQPSIADPGSLVNKIKRYLHIRQACWATDTLLEPLDARGCDFLHSAGFRGGRGLEERGKFLMCFSLACREIVIRHHSVGISYTPADYVRAVTFLGLPNGRNSAYGCSPGLGE